MNLNFARRPFRDYRPVYLVAGGALLAGVILFGVNATLYGDSVATSRTRARRSPGSRSAGARTQAAEEARSPSALRESAIAV